MKAVLDFLSEAVLPILAVSTLVQVLDMCGFLPQQLRKWLRLNRADDTLTALQELGIDVDLYRKSNSLVGIPRDYSKNVVEDTRCNLNKLKIDKRVSVGKIRQTELSYYIDLIGHTCEPQYACAYARLLSTHWAKEIEENQVKNPNIDFIVTPKGGSPILGYEFAKLVKKPFILHEDKERFHSEQDDMRKLFDCAAIPGPGARALIVDDSTTGGRMVLDTINDLKRYGYAVTECLVVFEPQSKDARKKLEGQGVNLISIVKTHNS